MPKKKSSSEEPKLKETSIFDFINYLTVQKKPWEKLTESERKLFNPFMTERWFSMSSDLLEIVAYYQKYTIEVLEKREVYNLWLDTLPKSRIYLKYIKGDKTEKYDAKLINSIKDYYTISKTEATEYIDILMKDEEGIESLRKILGNFPFKEKEIEKMIKI